VKRSASLFEAGSCSPAPITFEITDERVADQEIVRPLPKDVKLKGSLMNDKEEYSSS
jgi:hypothetical protein